jgi:predicted outer membrane repeat protein
MMRRSPLLSLILLAACEPTIPKDEGAELSGDGLTDGSDAGDGGADGQGDAGDGGDGQGDAGDGSDGADGADGGDGGGDGPVDADGDGVAAEDDCDDGDASSFPGAPELEGDGADNDCDGYTDEVEVCPDLDGELQAAIDDADDGAVLVICPGEFAGGLSLSGKEVTLVGAGSGGGREGTTLRGDGAGPVITVSGRGELGLVGLSLVGGGGASGGGALCQSATITLEDVRLADNFTTGNGAGLAAERCDVELAGSRFENNNAGGYGGGAHLSGSNGEVLGSTFLTNVALEGGGLFITGGNVDVLENTIESNQAIGASETVFAPGGGGGGLWTANSRTVRGNRIAYNSSNYNGGGAVFYGGSPDVEDNVVEGNQSGEDGGGLYFNQIAGAVSGNTVTGNVASDDGGGLRFYIGSAAIVGNTLIGNEAADDGGGVKVSHSEHEFHDNVLEDNVAGDAGGGLELDNDSSAVHNCTFRNNRAHRGAGLHNWRTERRFTISDSVFEGNEASDCGGGLSFDNSPYTISLRRLTLSGNVAGDGAGICADLVYRAPEDVGGVENYYQRSILDIRNLLFVDNAASSEGGAIYAKAADVVVWNITAVDNSGSGAVAVKGAALTLNNAILADNDGEGLYTLDIEEAATSLTVRYSDLWGNGAAVGGTAVDPTGSSGNIAADPRLTADHALGSGSACINTGDSAVRDADGSRSDMGLTGGPDAP